ncbi:probable beta-hexosaminidase fdl [Anoplophora glabripennis]|nr:probable beta-hexosaminidase fdl [Anoplophora glabripennis]XP_018567804.1 probable beta-hexosaminidase fdl [Anoplophora glabripennis]XP_018567814.1 probable beta-hexosaminidase fdl [Anoplophora glabripennis]XP_018567823.1 probable beta-hexosaminidase fdl [Anoplophora glabripennis]
MKQGELRRALMVVTLLCVFLFIYLYWQQTTKLAPTLVYNYKHVYSSYKKSHPPQWTWECINQRCERRSIKGGVAAVSLATCSMLCGSTQLWPQPTGPVTLGSRAVTFNHKQFELETVANAPARTLLEKAYTSFNENVVSMVEKKDYIKEKTDISKFLIRVTILRSEVVRLKLNTDESYTIVLKYLGNEVVANITAQTFFGARHGLETLSQLIWWDDYTKGGMLKVLKGATVQDTPIFAYRGLMVDTSRNFMSIESLKRVLVGMSASKLNVFHWHITDSQSFPLVVPSVPQLAKNGAYGPGMTYAPEEVKALVEFARVRGIRVVLEVDTPAHAGNGWTWGPQEGLGELAVCVNERPWSMYCGEPPCGQLNPENPNVYDVLEKLYRDLLDLSSEYEIFHIGGDEVNLECWAQHLQKSNTLYNYTDLHDLWGEFTVKALNRLYAANGNKKVPYVIVWSSKLSKRPYLTKYLDKSNVVVQSWGASQWPDTPDLIADGYKVVVSHVDAWYLDCGFGRWRETGDAACDPYRPWQTVYNHRPWQQLHLNTKQILGGEVALWSEQLDEGSLDARLWPRAAAFAERVWSDPQLDMSTYAIQEDVYTRLSTHRDRLVGRGLSAEALWPSWCTQNPGMCL